MATIAVVAALLLVAIVVAMVSSRGGGESTGGGGSRGGRTGTLPAAARGQELALLDGRLVVVAPEGWERLESTAETASIRVNLRDATGRELLATLVLTALPGAGPLDSTLTIDGGTRFEVTAGGGPIQGTVVPDRGQVLAGAIRPDGRFLISLSVFALDGQPLDAALLQKLFTEQVAPQLRFP
jgi:hypothetical protein